MRLSEKTIELNICAQLPFGPSFWPHWPVLEFGLPLWFRLTQKQEARAGFDACTRLGGRLILLQFKASNHVLRSGDRQFVAEHDQMESLRERCAPHRRSVFYVFPLVGTTLELADNPDVASQSWVLDVSELPALGAPTKRNGEPRKNRCHYIDVRPGLATIHSDPQKVILHKSRSLLDARWYTDPVRPEALVKPFPTGDSFDEFWKFRSVFLLRNTVALILPL